jgi:type VI secretion system protein ImpL
MTIAKNNLQNMELQAASTGEAPSRVAIWGLPLTAAALAVALLPAVWFYGELLGIPDGAPRTLVLISIPVLLVVVVVIHLVAISTGAYAGAARLLAFQTGPTTSTPSEPLNRDPRLQRVYEELRISHGWRWRRRLRWLLIQGNDERVEEVAPGLKQAGVMLMGETVLLHASPDGIEATKWLREIRQLRRRQPVDGVVHVARTDDQDSELPRKLSGIATALGWAAPVIFLHPVEASGSQPERFEPIGAFLPNDPRGQARSAAAMLPQILTELKQTTASAGVQMSGQPHWITWLLETSKYIGDHANRMAEGLRALAASHWLRAPLAGVMFAPVFAGASAAPVPVPVVEADETQDQPTAAAPVNEATHKQPPALLPVWQKIAEAVPRYRGRRTGWYWPNVLGTCALLAVVAWTAMLMVSGIGNQMLLHDAQSTAQAALDAKPQTASALRTQLALQQLIDTLEYRQQHGAPWYLRAGLSRNDDVLAALWRPYQTVATRNLQTPVVATLEALLKQTADARADALQSEDVRQSTYNTLKTYLMLAQPQHADAAFLRRTLAAAWPRPVEMPHGERDDTGRRLVNFYADHLKAHPEWQITAAEDIVTASRNALVTQMSLANADDTLYEDIVADAKGKYADASVETLLNGANARGLFSATQAVPGLYTRAAWDGMIAAAIERAARERRAGGDWVLAGAQAQQPAQANRTAEDAQRAADALKQRLKERYFSEYAAAWQRMLNSLHWQPAANLNGAIDQLTRLADAQTSPLVALFRSVHYQAQAGRPSQALTDTLVRKAQGLLSRNEDDAQAAAVANPLDKPFGPLLALMGDSTAPDGGKNTNAANVALSGVSLSRYLTAVTTMRLKLQQISGSPDAQAMARSLAQAVFQGKLSELTQARDDASLTAASLGTAWAGLGDALFAQPLEGAWQTILQPAAASLNDAWRASVAAPFNTAMTGRYPFFETQSDASFAELGRYVRPDTGLIARFIATQLAGVLKLEGDQWVPNELAPQALQFDPKFLAAIRQLSTLGAQAYVQGDAGYRFDIMALPSQNVTRTELNVDGRPVVYFNQQESWTALTWPGDGLNGRTGLMWQMVNAGLRQAFDASGDWAFLRLLAQAKIRALDSTRYELTWDQPDAAPLRYVLRTQVGAGPLDLLKLRDFRMPERIFVVGKAGAISTLPPLPPELMPS